MSDNIIQIDTIRIERNRPRKCVCPVRKFAVDEENREITCSCGIVVDPFEAMLYLATHYDRLNREHQSMNEQRIEWQKTKPHSVLFKGLEQHYRRGEMLPSCPKCEATFDFKDITFWTNAELYRKWELKQIKS